MAVAVARHRPVNQLNSNSMSSAYQPVIARTVYKNSKADADRWKTVGKPKTTKGPWSNEEDADLALLVEELGAEKWVAIADRLSSRTGKQCRERWHNHLDPKIKRTPFTAEEDAVIFDLYAKIGTRWAEMARHLPGRPDNAIKNHFNTSLQRSKRRQSSASLSSMTSNLDSTSSSSAGSPASPLAISGSSRYSPYKTRQRSGSSASSLSNSTSIPVCPSPLSPLSSSRGSSPSDLRTPPSRRSAPSLTASLGRDLDKDFFSPSRHSLLGFQASGPTTAPAEYGRAAFVPAYESCEPHSFAMIHGSAGAPLSSQEMQNSLSDQSYDYVMHQPQPIYPCHIASLQQIPSGLVAGQSYQNQMPCFANITLDDFVDSRNIHSAHHQSLGISYIPPTIGVPLYDPELL